jgi:uncharacterized membrane protein YphA (DoxX/SURF4 family)
MLGVTLVVQGAFCLSVSGRAVEVLGVAALLGGALLTVGFLTPMIGALAGLMFTLLIFLQTPVCKENFFDRKLSVMFAIGVLLALSLLGPGAFSIDARMFGRRRIVIPPRLRM